MNKSLIAIFSLVIFFFPWVSIAPTYISWQQQHRNLWQAMAGSFSLVKTAPLRKLQPQIAELTRDKSYFQLFSRNAQSYLYYVYQQTKQRNMPAEIALLPIIESDYYPFCHSSVGAEGLWQMMLPTAADLGITVNWWFDGRRDLITSTKGALSHLNYLHQYYGDWLLALAAYDAGQGPVNAAIRYNKKHHLPTNYWSLKLPKETEEYVPKLLAMASILQHPSNYHVKLLNIPNHPIYNAIEVKNQINLVKFAKSIGMDSETLLRLNPGFLRWITPPNKSYTLIIPHNKTPLAMQELQKLTPKTLWLHYSVRKIDNLSKVATQHNLSVDTLAHINHLSTNHIKAGQILLIPAGSQTTYQHQSAQQQSLSRHKVLAKETINTIAQKYHTTVSNIQFWNHLPNRQLTIGQNLVIYLPSQGFATHFRPTN